MTVYTVQYFARFGSIDVWLDLRSFHNESEAWAFYDEESDKPARPVSGKRQLRVVVKTTAVLERVDV